MPDPLSPEFWGNENTLLNSTMVQLALPIMQQAAESAIFQLPAGAQALVNWDVINADVIRYLNGPYAQANVPGLNATTLKQIRPIIEDWIRSGEPLEVLEAKFRPIFGDARASNWAATEVTRLYANGNLLAWGSSGLVSGKKWQTARDSLVCALCGPLHNKVVDLSVQFTQTVQDLINSPQLQAIVGTDQAVLFQRAQNLLKWNGASFMAPPRHPRCRCWLLPVVGLDLIGQQLDLALGLFGIDGLMRRFDKLGVDLAADFFATARRPELLDSLVKG